jgi:hypothetical protein
MLGFVPQPNLPQDWMTEEEIEKGDRFFQVDCTPSTQIDWFYISIHPTSLQKDKCEKERCI